MKTLLSLLLLFAASLTAQTTITLPFGTDSKSASVVLSLATGVTAGQIVYADREAMLIQALSGVNASVSRGYFNTFSTAHNPGVTALVGGFASFVFADPAGACTGSTVVINTSNGRKWTCTSGTWTYTDSALAVTGTVPAIASGNIAVGNGASIADSGTALTSLAPLTSLFSPIYPFTASAGANAVSYQFQTNITDASSTSYATWANWWLQDGTGFISGVLPTCTSTSGSGCTGTFTPDRKTLLITGVSKANLLEHTIWINTQCTGTELGCVPLSVFANAQATNTTSIIYGINTHVTSCGGWKCNGTNFTDYDRPLINIEADTESRQGSGKASAADIGFYSAHLNATNSLGVAFLAGSNISIGVGPTTTAPWGTAYQSARYGAQLAADFQETCLAANGPCNAQPIQFRAYQDNAGTEITAQFGFTQAGYFSINQPIQLPATPFVDTNGNTPFGVGVVSSAVDYLKLNEAISGSPGTPSISAAGTDTNISIVMTPKGTGNLTTTNAVAGAQFIAIGSAPTVANGAGAGTSPGTPTVTGHNMDHIVTVITGTATAASAILATITWTSTLNTAPIGCSLNPRNPAAITQVGAVYAGQPTTTSYNINVGASAVTASTTYIWYVHCE